MTVDDVWIERIIQRTRAFGPVGCAEASQLLREFIEDKGNDYSPDPTTYVRLLLAAGASRPRKRDAKAPKAE